MCSLHSSRVVYNNKISHSGECSSLLVVLLVFHVNQWSDSVLAIRFYSSFLLLPVSEVRRVALPLACSNQERCPGSSVLFCPLLLPFIPPSCRQAGTSAWQAWACPQDRIHYWLSWRWVLLLPLQRKAWSFVTSVSLSTGLDMPVVFGQYSIDRHRT